jgi:hypothetical protein
MVMLYLDLLESEFYKTKKHHVALLNHTKSPMSTEIKQTRKLHLIKEIIAIILSILLTGTAPVPVPFFSPLKLHRDLGT